jgi:hypothetical protein
VVVVEVEPDIILTDGYLEEEEEEDEQEAAPDLQTDRYDTVLLFITNVANPDPGSGAFLTPWKLELGWVKISGSGMNCSDHIISESLETSFWV